MTVLHSAPATAPYKLVAIQCAKYVLPLHVPDDFSDKVNTWFKSDNAESYIQHFFIINTDWATRSELVNHCKHANEIRAHQQRS